MFAKDKNTLAYYGGMSIETFYGVDFGKQSFICVNFFKLSFVITGQCYKNSTTVIYRETYFSRVKILLSITVVFDTSILVTVFSQQ
jgi:hypothetical protein